MSDLDDFYDYMPLDEYLEVIGRQGKKTAVAAGKKRGRSKGHDWAGSC